MDQRCGSCDDDYKESGATLKLCSGCKKVYYCSTACQKSSWAHHIFDCKPHDQINTAYYLARAVYRDLIPEHPQTCKDYGFDRAITPEQKTMLFGLYVGLIIYNDIPPKTVHNWRVRGVLVDEIKNVFYKLPEGSRGAYFPWFLQNEHIVALAGQPVTEKTMHHAVDAALLRAWRFTGGSEKDSAEEIKAAIERKPVKEKNCHHLYNLLLSKWHPSPSLELWVDFGFASCRVQQEEMGLGGLYQRLIHMCTFKEFYDAYRTHRLPHLFDSKGLQVNNRVQFRDLLQSKLTKSVWYLKQALAHEDFSKEESEMLPAVLVDYGFANCRNASEKRRLKKVYKDFFNSPNGDPLALHEAAIKGNIHGYISTVVKDLRDPIFQWLMKNPYPLPEFD
ncbi:hypothetical protein F5887DRAFT_591403 [Amanita rubescens]|nr:hypothetical protein F5887DRAFT_591403 [Amanita rubescens]